MRSTVRASGRLTRSAVIPTLAGLLMISGCATLPRRPAPAPDPSVAGWDALAEGRRADAARLFAARLAEAPGDPVALLGRATIFYERGESLAALADDVALLTALASASEVASAPLAAVAAGRVRDLWSELGPDDRTRIAASLRPVELARAPALPWLARVELARLADEIAREADDAEALARSARRDGCAPLAFEVGSLGPLAHLDLDGAAVATARVPAAWRALTASGCHLDIPLSADGRPDARLLRAAIEVPAGDY